MKFNNELARLLQGELKGKTIENVTNEGYASDCFVAVRLDENSVAYLKVTEYKVDRSLDAKEKEKCR